MSEKKPYKNTLKTFEDYVEYIFNICNEDFLYWTDLEDKDDIIITTFAEVCSKAGYNERDIDGMFAGLTGANLTD